MKEHCSVQMRAIQFSHKCLVFCCNPDILLLVDRIKSTSTLI